MRSPAIPLAIVPELSPDPVKQRANKSVVLFISALLSGCASFTGDRGMDAVSGMTAPALKADVIALRNDDDVAAADRTVFVHGQAVVPLMKGIQGWINP
ncbi:MAG: hypothetical protein PSV22_05935 [Pseudolabrys sp.]|jgi:hypothetical protein|nr:hypothetical protein [Pseudolabrys sp.]